MVGNDSAKAVHEPCLLRLYIPAAMVVIYGMVISVGTGSAMATRAAATTMPGSEKQVLAAKVAVVEVVGKRGFLRHHADTKHATSKGSSVCSLM